MRHLLVSIFFAVCLVSVCPQASAEADDPTEGWYTVRLSSGRFYQGAEKDKFFSAAPGDKFHIVAYDSKDAIYELYFSKVNNKCETCVTEKNLYKISSTDFDSKYWRRGRISHGLLVVPFKLRTKDQTLSGESSLE